jgi:hypothetical protein
MPKPGKRAGARSPRFSRRANYEDWDRVSVENVVAYAPQHQRGQLCASARPHDDQVVVARAGRVTIAGPASPRARILVTGTVAWHCVDGTVGQTLEFALDLVVERAYVDGHGEGRRWTNVDGSGTTAITVILPLLLWARSIASASATRACVEPSNATRSRRNTEFVYRIGLRRISGFRSQPSRRPGWRLRAPTQSGHRRRRRASRPRPRWLATHKY